ncbi:hypothetical protein ONZ45_g19307 [Pleurotus djamor]|nr:hypothetical protein ONZ45_g19307 [Pleurotus djamor]
MRYNHLVSISSLFSTVSAVSFKPLSEKPGLIDNGTFGPEIEIVHLFRDNAPIGITVNKGRAFVTFNRGDLSMTPITLGEIINETYIVPFPSMEYNTPPDGLVNSSSGVMVGSSDSKHFINIQAAVTDSRDRLWVLDTGRPIIKGDTLPAAPGGPKLMGFNLTNNATTPFSTITFPENVLPTTGYLNDIRIDLRTNVTEAGKGIAYISDSGERGFSWDMIFGC